LTGIEDAIQIQLTPAATWPAGLLRGTLKVAATTKDGNRIPATELQVYGEIVERVQANPKQMVFGQRQTGQKVEAFFVLTSTKGEPFVVDRIDTGSDEITVEPVGGYAIPGQAYKMTMTVSRKGTMSGKIKVITRDSGDALLGLVIPYYCYGVAP
jgi:hypothetical protein